MNLGNVTARRSQPAKTLRFRRLALALAIACCAVVAYKLVPTLLRERIETLPARPCNPATERCTAALPGGGNLTLSIAPNPILPLKPLQLEVALSGATAERVEVSFQGVTMDMGDNRSHLSGTGERFTGQAMLPICTTGTMVWSATVQVTTRAGSVAVPFHFEVAAR